MSTSKSDPKPNGCLGCAGIIVVVIIAGTVISWSRQNYFSNHRGEILEALEADLNDGRLESVVETAREYEMVDDPELNRLRDEANARIAKQRETEEAKRRELAAEHDAEKKGLAAEEADVQKRLAAEKAKVEEQLAASKAAERREREKTEVEKNGLAVVINSVEYKRTQFGIEVTGLIINRRGRKLSYAEVTYGIFDATGAKIGTAVDNITSLDSGGTWRFNAIGSIQQVGKGTVRLDDLVSF